MGSAEGMDLFAPARRAAGLGFGIATTGLRLATAAPRIAAGLLGRSSDDSSTDGDARLSAQRDAPSPTAGRTGMTDASVGATKAPPEPTSAAGASGGVAGTMDAPGAAETAGAPDPTVADSTRRQRTAPGGERRAVDVAPKPAAARHTPEITKGEAGRVREVQREAEASADEDAAASVGSAAPAASLRVDAPWEGYEKMRAPDVVTRLKASDETVKAVVRLYESTHKKRKSILDATKP